MAGCTILWVRVTIRPENFFVMRLRQPRAIGDMACPASMTALERLCDFPAAMTSDVIARQGDPFLSSSAVVAWGSQQLDVCRVNVGPSPETVGDDEPDVFNKKFLQLRHIKSDERVDHECCLFQIIRLYTTSSYRPFSFLNSLAVRMQRGESSITSALIPFNRRRAVQPHHIHLLERFLKCFGLRFAVFHIVGAHHGRKSIAVFGFHKKKFHLAPARAGRQRQRVLLAGFAHKRIDPRINHQMLFHRPPQRGGLYARRATSFFGHPKSRAPLQNFRGHRAPDSGRNILDR